jgi:2-polyprenyl-6-methoxyphenol hydroxylase-like FAD-dependent oxidoreductase
MNIVVLGGGVAGISSAIALKQKGFDVTVYERHKSEKNIGAGIVAWPNATYILDKLGVLNKVRTVSGYPSSMQRLSSKGDDLGSIDIESINEIMCYPSLSILRNDFQSILISKLKELGVSVKYGHTVSKLETTKNNNVKVHFSNGVNITADVVIGADGRMTSLARKYVNGENKPIYQGFINWIGVFESETKVFKDIAVKDYWGRGERFGIVPISQNKAYWAGGVASKNINERNPEIYKEELKSIFSSWSNIIEKVITETPVEKINKIYVHDHNPMRKWHKNNLIVIGDASHAPLPTSGQGACQALEDAWYLSECLIENNANIENSFTQFTELRYEKTKDIIFAGRNLASTLFNPDAEFCRVRNENSKKTDYSTVSVAMAKFWGQNMQLAN